MRLCGLSSQNRSVLHASHLDDRFRSYDSRVEAIMGGRPASPQVDACGGTCRVGRTERSPLLLSVGAKGHSQCL